MTETELILQAALDANPYDFVCRMALADHLIEIGDERGEGYKALAELERVPMCSDAATKPYYWNWFVNPQKTSCSSQLGDHWCRKSKVYDMHDSLKSACDWAAIGWLQLTTSQRKSLYKKFYRGAK